MSCPRCNGETYAERRGQHIGLFCRKCGYLKFIPQPWETFTMPFGKYKGKNLAEIKKLDSDYLRWVVYNVSSKSIAARAKESLTGDLERICDIPITPEAFNG